MPETRVVFFMETDGSVPIVDWLDSLPEKARDKCNLALMRLRELGHELRRPEGDYLRDGIYELRVGFRGQNYRILYFFHNNVAGVVSHGIVKERVVPAREIERAIANRLAFLEDPAKHSFEEDIA